MKITLRLIFSLLAASAVVVLAFSYFQTQNEEKRLNEELRLRSSILSKSFQEVIEPFLEQTERPERIQKFIEKFQGHKRLIGVIVDLRETARITLPSELSKTDLFQKESHRAMEEARPVEVNGKWDSRNVYFYVVPLHKAGAVVGSIGLIHDRSFIVAQIREFWKRSALTFSVLAFILSIVTLIIIRWNILNPIVRIQELVKKATRGEMDRFPEEMKNQGEIEKLVHAVVHMASSLKSARLDLEEQSRLVNAQGTIWTRERLKDYLQTQLEGKPLFVVANREPYIHRKKGNSIECIVPASGVVTALDPVMQVTDGTWIAHGSGDADHESTGSGNKLRVPPWKPTYTLKRVWLDETEEKGYYYGFSNEGLWPLCHISHVRPVFRLEDWQQYQVVNRKFADVLLEEFGDLSPFVLVQDYHLALLPKLIKEKRPDAKIALFWHIPWPNPEAFGICPWQEEILEGMLSSNVIGFHTQFHCNNFLDTVDRVLESRIDWTNFAVTRSGKTSFVRPFPISIATSSNGKESEIVNKSIKELRRTYNLEGKLVGVGVDRIDYTKGLLERFRSIERLFEKYPQHRGKLVFVELGAPSRSLIPAYQRHLTEIDELVQKINAKFADGNYLPILFLKDNHTQEKIHLFYRLADFCLVSSLHDGMNLVAKEFVMSREDENSVLILSRFTGASHEFKSALLINPYDIEETAEAIRQALEMSLEEKTERMRKMRSTVREYNVYRWTADVITELIKS